MAAETFFVQAKVYNILGRTTERDSAAEQSLKSQAAFDEAQGSIDASLPPWPTNVGSKWATLKPNFRAHRISPLFYRCIFPICYINVIHNIWILDWRHMRLKEMNSWGVCSKLCNFMICLTHAQVCYSPALRWGFCVPNWSPHMEKRQEIKACIDGNFDL